MMQVMGNNCCKLKLQNQSVIPLLLLGLNDSGKTTIGHILTQLPRNDFTPTNGCLVHKFKFEGSTVKLIEIGGNPSIRDIWKLYYKNAMGVIFTIDASNVENLYTAKEVLHKLIHHPDINGKPILIIATKSDKEITMNINDLTEVLKLEQIANQLQSPCCIESNCPSDNNGIYDGLRWLISLINNKIKFYKNRIIFGNLEFGDLDSNLDSDNDGRPFSANTLLRKVVKNNKENLATTQSLKIRKHRPTTMIQSPKKHT